MQHNSIKSIKDSAFAVAMLVLALHRVDAQINVKPTEQAGSIKDGVPLNHLPYSLGGIGSATPSSFTSHSGLLVASGESQPSLNEGRRELSRRDEQKARENENIRHWHEEECQRNTNTPNQHSEPLTDAECNDLRKRYREYKEKKANLVENQIENQLIRKWNLYRSPKPNEVQGPPVELTDADCDSLRPIYRKEMAQRQQLKEWPTVRSAIQIWFSLQHRNNEAMQPHILSDEECHEKQKDFERWIENEYNYRQKQLNNAVALAEWERKNASITSPATPSSSAQNNVTFSVTMTLTTRSSSAPATPVPTNHPEHWTPSPQNNHDLTTTVPRSSKTPHHPSDAVTAHDEVPVAARFSSDLPKTYIGVRAFSAMSTCDCTPEKTLEQFRDSVIQELLVHDGRSDSVVPGTKNVPVSEASPSVLTDAILPEDLRRSILGSHILLPKNTPAKNDDNRVEKPEPKEETPGSAIAWNFGKELISRSLTEYGTLKGYGDHLGDAIFFAGGDLGFIPSGIDAIKLIQSKYIQTTSNDILTIKFINSAQFTTQFFITKVIPNGLNLVVNTSIFAIFQLFEYTNIGTDDWSHYNIILTPQQVLGSTPSRTAPEREKTPINPKPLGQKSVK